MMRVNLSEIEAVADLIAQMADGDEQAFVDTLEGETDAIDALRDLVRLRVEVELYAAGAKDAAQLYLERVRRMNARKDAITRAMGDILDATGQQKLAFDLATVSRTKARQSCVIADADAIPSQLCKRVPDSAAIKKQLEAGEDVPGARLEFGQPGLTVRVK